MASEELPTQMLNRIMRLGQLLASVESLEFETTCDEDDNNEIARPFVTKPVKRVKNTKEDITQKHNLPN